MAVDAITWEQLAACGLVYLVARWFVSGPTSTFNSPSQKNPEQSESVIGG